MIKSTVKKYLEDQPLFRERKNKDRGIVNILMRRYPKIHQILKEELITKDELAEIMREYSSMDREWRRILSLEENAHLRGSDYEEKERLEAQKMADLGYNVNGTVKEENAVEDETQKSLL